MNVNIVSEEVQKKANAIAREHGYSKATHLITDKRRKKYKYISGHSGMYVKISTGEPVSKSYRQKSWKGCEYREEMCIVAIPFSDAAASIAKETLT